jgi:hypothetical protein
MKYNYFFYSTKTQETLSLRAERSAVKQSLNRLLPILITTVTSEIAWAKNASQKQQQEMHLYFISYLEQSLSTK